ncbi:cob(I)yrinic acid a,c-diamide adenosyltransferase [Anaerosacchariphilus polymeriproducens]|uniref:Cob(I)yrinic acid a c-diamide adenosyltransferase n=1 Tax=Anaerosacchariphilus polymeriproducens TaxID=1812858 RepID=A0A371AW11_9FIRM|nr:cob(I)yrinic acid a,c-diamide adenosyltransferase [Anaerosacchariphilus polymeriproducens]RDU23765.1 cob(I)yrinic acid a c-diamide adenosyltransferase [Anaerosacchariphilus polymeriproducens]
MGNGIVQIYCGVGKGKTTAALGQAIKEASQGKSVIIIQFLKGKSEEEIHFISKLEPDIKLFRFEKSNACFDQLTKEQQEEERMNIKNGLNFAKKVLDTGECDVLILDEILGLLDYKVITAGELINLIQLKEETNVILTGRTLDEKLIAVADSVYNIEIIK